MSGLSQNIIPDFSSRGSAPPIPDLSGRSAPPPKPIPKGDGKPFNYNKPPTIPDFKPVYVSPALSVSKSAKVKTVTPPAPPPISQFSPSIETYPTANNSYFLTELDVGNAVSLWAGYPAINNVNLSNFSILNGGSASFTSLTSGNISTLGSATIGDNLVVGGNATVEGSGSFGKPVSLLNTGQIPGKLLMSDNNGNQHTLESLNGDLFFDTELLAKAGDIQNIADWSLYPAISTIDMIGNPIIGASGVTITDGSHPQLLSASVDGLQVNGATVVTGNYVKTLNADIGDVTLSSINGSVSITKPVGGVIDFSVSQGAGGVASINSQTGAITFQSADTSIAITNPSAGIINLATTAPAVDISKWADYAASQQVNCSSFGITCQPIGAGTSYSFSQLDTNLTIGKASYFPFFPDVIMYPAKFQIGSLVAPATSISFTSLVDISITGGAGVSVTGGGGLSLIGGGGITALGATVTLGAGAISALGGSINLGAGTINMAGGLINAIGTAINVGGGLITATTGGLLVTAGSVVVGTSTNAGAGIVCYGGTIQCVPSIIGGGGGLDMTNQCPIIGVTSITGNNISMSSVGMTTIGNLAGTYLEISDVGGLIGHSDNEVIIGNPQTVLNIGNSLTVPPTTGLYFDDTRLLFNNAPIGGGGGGVTALNTQTGSVSLTSANTGTLVVGSTGAGNVQLSVPVGAGGVASLNTQSGSLTLTSANTNIVVGSTGAGNLQLTAPTPVQSLNTLTGGLTLAAGTGISITPSGGNTLTIENTSLVKPIWLVGGDYTNPGVTFVASTNTLIKYLSITTTAANTKVMIFGTFDAVSAAPSVIYMTLARSTAIPTAANSTNLVNGTSAMTNSISGSGLSMWAASSSASRLTAVANVIDTLAAPGTYYYSLWGWDASVITPGTTELANITILDVTGSGGSSTAFPAPVIQAAGTTALIPTTANTTYILTSGATQNFTTAGLGVGNAGAVWYVKNAFGSDINIQHNGGAITGQTATLHTNTGSTNSAQQIIYWNGTNLFMY